MEKWSQYRLESDEGKKKAESLFSKRFMEYLSSKKLSAAPIDKTRPPSRHPPYTDRSPASSSSDDAQGAYSPGKIRKRLNEEPTRRTLDFNSRNKVTQCSLLKLEEEMGPPEELKPLLFNLTSVLQGLKQSACGFGDVYNQIMKISILLTEFIRRPLKKVIEERKSDYSRNLHQTTEKMVSLLNEYKTGPGLDVDTGFREYKKMEREIGRMKEEIAEMKMFCEERVRDDPKIKDLGERVRRSILENERLKAEVKFNKSHVKKYKKLLLEKEWTKHKLATELTHLKLKLSKFDMIEGESFDASNTPESIGSETSQLRSPGLKFKGLKVKKWKDKMKTNARFK